MFFTFFKCTNGTKSRKISHMNIYLESGKLYYPLSSTKWWRFVTKSCIFWSIYKVRTHIVPCDVTIPVAVDLWSYWEQMMLQGRQDVQVSCKDDSKKLTSGEEITWWKIKFLFFTNNKKLIKSKRLTLWTLSFQRKLDKSSGSCSSYCF